MRLVPLLLGLGPVISVVNGHLAAWHKGMYCLNGTVPGFADFNARSPVTPLYQLSQKDWWFHHIDGCDNFPPAEGDFLELPAGGQFTVELAGNRGQTSLSFNGRFTSEWPDGQQHPEDFHVPTCITSPNMHAQNQSMAAGTAFAISYQSNIRQVTPENLAVFTVRYHTPWKRITTYDVPAALPACPPDGCICAWGWVPNGCGQPNMYHQPFKCKVTNATSTAAVVAPQPPVWCEDDPSKCVKGSKQMLYWHQLEGNNIEVEGFDLSNSPKSPAYNEKCGFSDGAQNDIFAQSPQKGGGPSSSVAQAPTPTSTNKPGGITNPQPSNSTSGAGSSNSHNGGKCRKKKNHNTTNTKRSVYASHRRMQHRAWS